MLEALVILPCLARILGKVGSICAAMCTADLANCRVMFHMPRVKEYAEVGQGSWHNKGEF